MPLLDRLKAAVGGATGPASEVMSFSGPEPCEECGASPADDMVGVRWLCGSCAPEARRQERAESEAIGAARVAARTADPDAGAT